MISTRTSFLLGDGSELGEYIPFYFGVRMPMLYVIQKGYNSVKQLNAADIVYCVTSVKSIVDEGIDFMFTDGHAVDGFSKLFSPNKIKHIEKLVDWKAVRAKYWKDENDLDLKRRKEAEFLVKSDVPIAAIEKFIVYNAGAAAQIKAMKGYNGQSLIVNPNCYF